MLVVWDRELLQICVKKYILHRAYDGSWGWEGVRHGGEWRGPGSLFERFVEGSSAGFLVSLLAGEKFCLSSIIKAVHLGMRIGEYGS